MNSEQTEELISLGPNLFRTYEQERERMSAGLKGQSAAPFMPIAFGFECGPGWFEVLKELIINLEAEIEKLPEDEREYVYATQVKEKYGGLRFYMSRETEAMQAYIRAASRKAAKTCETCGASGEIKGDYRLKCVCEGCDG